MTRQLGPEGTVNMVDVTEREHYLALAHNVWTWCKQYLDGNAIVADATYDSMKGFLAQIESENPEWVVAWSPVGKPMCGIPEGNEPNQNDVILNEIKAIYG